MIADRMIYGGKCRCCGGINIFDFGEASDSQEQLLNMYINDKLTKAFNTYCEECEGRVVHDLLIYGKKSELKKVIKKLENDNN